MWSAKVVGANAAGASAAGATVALIKQVTSSSRHSTTRCRSCGHEPIDAVPKIVGRPAWVAGRPAREVQLVVGKRWPSSPGMAVRCTTCCRTRCATSDSGDRLAGDQRGGPRHLASDDRRSLHRYFDQTGNLLLALARLLTLTAVTGQCCSSRRTATPRPVTLGGWDGITSIFGVLTGLTRQVRAVGRRVRCSSSRCQHAGGEPGGDGD